MRDGPLLERIEQNSVIGCCFQSPPASPPAGDMTAVAAARSSPGKNCSAASSGCDVRPPVSDHRHAQAFRIIHVVHALDPEIARHPQVRDPSGLQVRGGTANVDLLLAQDIPPAPAVANDTRLGNPDQPGHGIVVDLDREAALRSGRLGKGQHGNRRRVAIPSNRRSRIECLPRQAGVVRQFGQCQGLIGSRLQLLGLETSSQDASRAGRVTPCLGDQPLPGKDRARDATHVQGMCRLESLPMIVNDILEVFVPGADVEHPATAAISMHATTAQMQVQPQVQANTMIAVARQADISARIPSLSRRCAQQYQLPREEKPHTLPSLITGKPRPPRSTGPFRLVREGSLSKMRRL